MSEVLKCDRCGMMASEAGRQREWTAMSVSSPPRTTTLPGGAEVLLLQSVPPPLVHLCPVCGEEWSEWLDLKGDGDANS